MPIVGNLFQLTFSGLSNNIFVDQIPSSFWNLNQLITLDVSSITLCEKSVAASAYKYIVLQEKFQNELFPLMHFPQTM